MVLGASCSLQDLGVFGLGLDLCNFFIVGVATGLPFGKFPTAISPGQVPCDEVTLVISRKCIVPRNCSSASIIENGDMKIEGRVRVQNHDNGILKALTVPLLGFGNMLFCK